MTELESSPGCCLLHADHAVEDGPLGEHTATMYGMLRDPQKGGGDDPNFSDSSVCRVGLRVDMTSGFHVPHHKDVPQGWTATSEKLCTCLCSCVCTHIGSFFFFFLKRLKIFTGLKLKCKQEKPFKK